jgi:selenocysteine lyase/cysteine desulfurase
MDIDAIRAQIPALRDMTYLNTGWSGPSPTRVVDATVERLRYESFSGPTTAEVLDTGKEITADTRQAVARLLNASSDEVLLTQNTTDGLNIVMNGLPWQPSDEVITCDLEHVAIIAPLLLAQRQKDIKVVCLTITPNESPAAILTKMEGAINERTRMVFLSHVEYSSGLRMPAKEIRQLTEARNLWFMLDGAQAAGNIAVDVKEIGCDFYSIPSQKWLLGPDGIGALYMRRDLIPTVATHTVGYEAIETFDYPTGHGFKTDAVERFITGTTSVPLQAGLLAAIRFVNEIGVDRIEGRNKMLASLLKSRLADIRGVGILSPTDDEQSSGLVTFMVDGIEPTEVVARLWTQDRILVRDVAYPPSVRVSLHFFNTENEVEQVTEAIRGLIKAR